MPDAFIEHLCEDGQWIWQMTDPDGYVWRKNVGSNAEAHELTKWVLKEFDGTTLAAIGSED